MRSGVIAEFDSADRVISGVAQLRTAGYRRIEVYSPYPLEDLSKLLGQRRPNTARFTFFFGAAGAGFAFWLQWWTSVEAYPLNVGGFPLNSWPAFIPITFETLILVAAVSTFFVLLIRLGLPQLYHPLFAVEGFERSAVDRFFIAIESEDEIFEVERAIGDLRALSALRVSAVGRIS